MYIHNRSGNGQFLSFETNFTSSTTAMTAAGTSLETMAPFCPTAGQSARDEFNELIRIAALNLLTAGQNVSVVSRITTPSDYTANNHSILLEFSGSAMFESSASGWIIPFIASVATPWTFTSQWATATGTNPTRIVSASQSSSFVDSNFEASKSWNELLLLDKGTDWQDDPLYAGVAFVAPANSGASITEVIAQLNVRLGIRTTPTFEKGFG